MSQLIKQTLSSSQTIFISVMDLEKNKLKLSVLHPTSQLLPTRANFKTVDLSLNTANVPLHDKINFHRQTGEMRYHDLSKSSLSVRKCKKLLEKAYN